MDLSNIVAADLNETNVDAFLSAFDSALANGEYDKIKDAIHRINDFLIAGKVIVGKNRSDTENQSNFIEVTNGSNTEKIFVDKIADHVVSKIKDDYTNNPGTNADRDAVKNELNKNLTAIFNQDKLLATLAMRDFSIDKFEKQAEKANEVSKNRIKSLKQQKDTKKKKYETFFGKDSEITTGDYTLKGYFTRIKECKEAIATLDVAKSQFELINDLEAKKTADPSKASEYDSQITRAKNNLKYLGEKIIDMNLPGIDKDLIVDWESDSTKFSNYASTIAVATSLIDGALLRKAYKELKNKVSTMQPADKVELGITSDIEDQFSKVNDSDKNVRATARGKVDKYLKDMQRLITMGIDSEIAMEERLIELRTQNVEHYKEVIDRVKNSKVKVRPGETRPKRKRDTNGNYTVVDGKYEIEVDPNTGNPLTEEVMDVPTDSAVRDEFLQKTGYDRSQELINIDSSYSGRAARRHALEVLKIGNRFTRFFAPNRLWKKYNARNKILARRENDRIELQMRKEYEELVPDIEEVSKFAQLLARVKESAAIRHVLYSAGKEQGWDADSKDKTSVVDEMENAAYEEALYKANTAANGEISDIRKKKAYTHEALVKKHSSQTLSNELIHEEENNDMEL